MKRDSVMDKHAGCQDGVIMEDWMEALIEFLVAYNGQRFTLWRWGPSSTLLNWILRGTPIPTRLYSISNALHLRPSPDCTLYYGFQTACGELAF